jgi:prophage tail gpP-like protein
MVSDDLTLAIGNSSYAGWDSVSVTRSIEGCPSSFELSLTERYPGEAQNLVMQPGDTCVVSLGEDVVVTGYVDRFAPSITATGHTIRVSGRGKCQDLVDCAAEWPNGQISGSSAWQIAQNLAKPYGITVIATADDVGAPIPQFNLILGETSYEVIERVSRYRGLLAYELPDGSLFLTRVGTISAASGFEQGVNVQEADVEYSMDGRYSEYLAFLQSVQVFGDIGNGGNLLTTVTDPGVRRPRRTVIIAEAGGGGQDVCKQRALWEAARRAGRSYQVRIVTDSWRDSDGNLWEPNTIVPVLLPALKLPDYTWVIGSVTYRRDENGTTAEIFIMPNSAFLPEPILLQPFAPDVPPGIAG